MSSPSPMLIDKDDLWFLEVASELGTSLAMLLGPRSAEAVNMRRGHGLSVEELAEKLASLVERGLVQVLQSEEGGGAIRRTRSVHMARFR